MLCLVLVLGTGFTAQANSIEQPIKVEMFSDGRVKPISRNLSEHQFSYVLTIMGFTDEEISDMPLAMRKDIVKGGGKKIQLTEAEIKEIYRDQDGNIYDLSSSSDVGTFYYTDPDKTIYGNLVYRGKIGSEYSYYYYANYNWKQYTVYNNDRNRLALSWQYNATPIGVSHQSYAEYTNTLGITYNALKAVTKQLLGTDIRVTKDGIKSNGYIREELRIPERDKGLTGAFAVGYAWPYSPTASITISYGPASISFSSFWGWEKTMIYNWKIGEDPPF